MYISTHTHKFLYTIAKQKIINKSRKSKHIFVIKKHLCKFIFLNSVHIMNLQKKVNE